MQIHRQGTAAHNWYIVEDAGKATVIDAGCSKEFPHLVKGLAAIGLGALGFLRRRRGHH